MVEKQEFETMIVRYLRGEATPEEAMALEDWKAENRDNLEMFNQYEKLILGEKSFRSPNLDKAWDNIRPEQKNEGRVISINRWAQWVTIAAASVALVFFAYNYNVSPDGNGFKASVPKLENQENNNILYAKNGLRNFTLTDNSVVELSQGSSLELNDDFAIGERRAKLKGSGRFTVVHDEKHPFVIEVAGLEVYDIGTVFDIKTLEDTVKVVVYEGAVELRLNNETLALEAGDSAFYLISDQIMDTYAEVEGRKDVIFEFDGTSLSEVVSVLEKFFNQKIVIMNEELNACKLHIRFKNQSLAEILDYIAATLDLKVVKKSNKIELYGEGC